MKTPKLRVTGLYEGNTPVTGEFPAQRASNAENVSIWWHHDIVFRQYTCTCTYPVILYWNNFSFVARAITKKLRKFHMTNPDKLNLVDCEGNTGVKYNRTMKWEQMQDGFIAQYPEKLKDPEKDKM